MEDYNEDFATVLKAKGGRTLKKIQAESGMMFIRHKHIILIQ